MKKRIYLMLVMLTTPLLLGCKNETSCSFVFNSDYLLMNNKRHYTKNKKKPVTLTLTLQEEYKPTTDLPFPDDLTVLIGEKDGVIGEDYEYKFNDDKKTATLSICIVDDITVTAYQDSSDNYFHISEDKFDEAVNMSDPDIEFAQRSYEGGVLSGGSIASLQYLEEYTSPTIYHRFERRVESSVYPAKECYVKKNSDTDYVKKSREGYEEWGEEETADPSDFQKPSDFTIKVQLDVREITYDKIKDSYDQERHGYFFNSIYSGKPYSYALGFYKNRLAFFAYEYFKEESTLTQYGTMNFSYGTIQPVYPE